MEDLETLLKRAKAALDHPIVFAASRFAQPGQFIERAPELQEVAYLPLAEAEALGRVVLEISVAEHPVRALVCAPGTCVSLPWPSPRIRTSG